MYIKLTADECGVTVAGEQRASLGSAARRLGPWACWEWNGTEFHAKVDRYGFYPLFYAPTKGGVAVSNSIAELLALGAGTAFDDGAIAAFLRLGFFLGDDTPFETVRAFPVGGRLEWTATTGLTVHGAAIPRVTDTSLSRNEAIDGYVERFRNAVARCLPLDPRHTALPLSGGRDSRHIALELKRLDFQPGLVISQRHFSSRSDQDAEIAAQLCEALAWPITVESQIDDPVHSELLKNRRFDCLTDEHGWFVPSARRLEGAGITTAFDGLAGDVLSKGLFVRERWLELGRAGKLAEALDGLPDDGYGARECVLDALLGEPYRRRWNRELARARMAREISHHRNDDNPMNLFFFWNRTRREIAPFLARHLPAAEILTPYLDPEVFDFLWSLPTEYFEDHRFHDEAIARSAPEYAAVPFATGKAPDRAGHFATLVQGMARRSRFWFGGTILNRGSLRPRLGRALLSRRFARDAGWWGPNWAIWLASLEELALTAG